MGTRSMIAVKVDDVFQGVYCHLDGYPEHMGKMLLNHYETLEKAIALLELGDLVSVNETLEMTVAFARDKGEELCPAEKFDSYEEMKDFFTEADVEFFYLLQDGEWLVNGEPLTPELVAA